MIGNAKRFKLSSSLYEDLTGSKGQVRLQPSVSVRARYPSAGTTPHYTFGELLELMGILPIPPYLDRETEAGDLITYQTVYAQREGSVAAPTAGLHFTPEVFASSVSEG